MYRLLMGVGGGDGVRGWNGMDWLAGWLVGLGWVGLAVMLCVFYCGWCTIGDVV